MDHEQQGPLLARPGAAQELMTADWRVLYCFALPWKSLATDWYSEVDAVGTAAMAENTSLLLLSMREN